MISSIKGILVQKKELSLIIEIGGFRYDVLVPMSVLNELKDKKEGDEIELITFHYYALDPSKGIPMLIGFTNEVEKEFFEKFITVSGIGPKAAVKALNRPISEIARAIDSSDLEFLKKLPRIGEQKAKEIIAKLQGKVGKYGLMQDSFDPSDMGKSKKDVQEEAIQILIQLQYRKQEAQEMVKKAMDRDPGISTSEELLNEVYRQRRQAR